MLNRSLHRWLSVCLIFAAIYSGASTRARASSLILDPESDGTAKGTVNLNVTTGSPVTFKNEVTNLSDTSFIFHWPSAGPGGFSQEVPARIVARHGTRWTWQTARSVSAFTGDQCTTDFCIDPEGTATDPIGPFGAPGRTLLRDAVTLSSASLTTTLIRLFTPLSTSASAMGGSKRPQRVWGRWQARPFTRARLLDETLLFSLVSSVDQLPNGMYSYRTRVRNGTTNPIVTKLSRVPLGCVSFCGDGQIEGSEQCDGSNVGGFTCGSFGLTGDLGCLSDCTFDLSGCSPTVCGDGVAEGFEQCDGSDLGGATCGTFGGDSGILACDSGCNYDLSGCTLICGNGVLDSGEACDGSDLGGATCGSLQGGATGTLGCDPGCQDFDVFQCVDFCGNGVTESGEQCDSSSADCQAVGLFGFAPCNSDCRIDTQFCHEFSCGDGTVNPGEDCDGSNLDDHSCQDFGTPGFLGGTLGCFTEPCRFDLTGCPNVCGNGIKDPNEQCEGSNLGGFTCADFGKSPNGFIFCDSECNLDASLCESSGVPCDLPDRILTIGPGEDRTISERCDSHPAKEDSGAVTACGTSIPGGGETCDGTGSGTTGTANILVPDLDIVPSDVFFTVTGVTIVAPEGDGVLRPGNVDRVTIGLANTGIAPVTGVRVRLISPPRDLDLDGKLDPVDIRQDPAGIAYPDGSCFQGTPRDNGTDCGTPGGPPLGCQGERPFDVALSDQHPSAVARLFNLEITYTRGQALGGGATETVTVPIALGVADGICGDGRIQGSEECDDANTLDGDCCSSLCTLNKQGTECGGGGTLCNNDSCDGLGLCLPSNFCAAHATVELEGCDPRDESVEAGETLTVGFGLRNGGDTDTGTVVATLLATGGVLSPGDPQSYGVLPRGAAPVTRSFTFTADPSLSCGGTLTATLQLRDGSTDLGIATFTFPVGRRPLAERFDSVHAPLLPDGWMTSHGPGTGVRDPFWVTSRDGADTIPNSAFSPDQDHVSDNRVDSPRIPIHSDSARLTFRHSYSLDQDQATGGNGGVLEIAIDNDPFEDIVLAGGSFVEGGYNGTISGQTRSPIAGRACWTDSSNGFITTTVQLPPGAAAHDVTLRWRVGTRDQGVQGRRGAGWRIDSVSIQEPCAACTVTQPCGSLPFSDPFTAPALDACWSFVDPVGDSRLSLADGEHLTLTIPAGTEHDCWNSGANCTRIVRDIPTGDASYETKIDGPNISLPNQDYGLFFIADPCNHVRFEYWSGRQGVYARAYRVAACVGVRQPLLSTPSPISLGASNYLRTKKTGSAYRFEYKIDGGPWILVGTTNIPSFSPNKVGFFVLNAVDLPGNSARVDYFNGAPTGDHTLTIESGPSGSPNPVVSSATAALAVSALDSFGHGLAYTWSSSCSLPTASGQTSSGTASSPATLPGSDGAFSDPHVQNPQWTAPQNATGRTITCVITVAVSDEGFGLRASQSYNQLVTPENAPCGGFPVHDPFSSPLDACWNFVNPAGGTSSVVSDHLEISLPAGTSHDCWNSSPNCARLVRPVPNSDAVFETKLDGANIKKLSQDYGILLYQDSTNYVRFMFWTRGAGVYVRAYKIINGAGVLPAAITTGSPITLGSSNTLRVTRTGNTYTLAYRIDDGPWITAGSLTQAGFAVNQAGMFVNNNVTDPATTGLFDYFTATAAP